MSEKSFDSQGRPFSSSQDLPSRRAIVPALNGCSEKFQHGMLTVFHFVTPQGVRARVDRHLSR